MPPVTLPYLADGHERHLLDVYLPPQPAGCPVVLVIHGGGLNALSKERMAGVSRQLAEHGFAAVTPNYRLLDHAPYPAQVEDCLAALTWVHQGPAVLEGCDVGRVGVLGASAGAFLGQMLAAGLGSAQVRCLVSVSGPSDVRYRRPDGGEDCPLELITPSFPPTLVTHSRNDRVVAFEHAEKLAAALARAGVVHELFAYDRPEEDHGIWAPGVLPPVFLDFLEAGINAFLGRWLAVR